LAAVIELNGRKKMKFRTYAVSSLFFGGALVSACTAANPITLPDGGTSVSMRTDSCMNYGWRLPTPGGVICPGTSSCLCTGADVFCLGSVDGQKGMCEAAGKCRALLLACDGPEDCNAGTSADVSDGGAGDAAAEGGGGSPDAGPKPPPRVCCLDEAIGTSGGGSMCKSISSCTGKVLCRSDDDCIGAPNGLNKCRPVDYGTPGVEDRGLDGLMGFCTK
jgi:hypothetical protein